MDTLESTHALISPFTGAALDAGQEREYQGYAQAAYPAATSPFTSGFSVADEQEAVERQWLSLAEALADEGFEEAVDSLADEAAGRYLVARSRMPDAPESADLARQDVESWLADHAEAADRTLARLEQEYADPPTATMSEAEASAQELSGENPIGAASQQFLGGLVRKGFKAASSVAKAGLAGLAKVLPVGRIFGLLRRLVRPLLQRVLEKALGRLPAELQQPARDLARRLGVAESEEPTLAEAFDQQFAQLLVAPTEGQADQVVAEFEAGSDAGTHHDAEDVLARLDRARSLLAQQLAEAEPGRPPTEQLEQFIPVVMAAMPLIRTGLSLIGRDKVIRFLAGHLATLIQPHIGPVAARALAPRIADTGLRLLSLEAAAPERLGAESLVDTLEETVRTVLELPEASLENPLRLQAAADTALAESAARLLPATALRPDLDTFETTEHEGHWVAMPRQTPGCRRYRKFSRVFDVSISRPQARAILLSGEDTLEDRLAEAGVESWPVRGEVHLFEAMDGTQPGHLAAFEEPQAQAEEFEELSPQTAGLLVGQPGLGRRPSFAPYSQPGRRLFRLVVPGHRVRRRHPRLVVRVDVSGPRPTLRLHLRLGERSTDVLTGHLTRQALPEALSALSRLLPPAVRQHLAQRLAVRLHRALAAPVPAGRAEALAGQLVESMLRTLATQLPGSTAAVLAAAKDPAPGITLTFSFPFDERAAVLTGTPGTPTMTIRPGRRHD